MKLAYAGTLPLAVRHAVYGDDAFTRGDNGAQINDIGDEINAALSAAETFQD